MNTHSITHLPSQIGHHGFLGFTHARGGKWVCVGEKKRGRRPWFWTRNEVENLGVLPEVAKRLNNYVSELRHQHVAHRVAYLQYLSSSSSNWHFQTRSACWSSHMPTFVILSKRAHGNHNIWLLGSVKSSHEPTYSSTPQPNPLHHAVHLSPRKKMALSYYVTAKTTYLTFFNNVENTRFVLLEDGIMQSQKVTPRHPLLIISIPVWIRLRSVTSY